MKKLIISLLATLFVCSCAVAANPLSEKQLQKEAKKEAKRLTKEGWQSAPGAFSLEHQLQDVYAKRADRDELGREKFIIGSSQPIGEFYDAAKMQANMLARLDIVEQISSQMTAILEASVGNKQLSHDEAASVAQVIGKAKELISGKLTRTSPLLECSRKLPNGNVEIMIRIGYPTARALEEAKQVVREKLEEELNELAEKFDKVVNY